VRAHGRLSQLPSAGLSDHVCWVYDDDESLDRAVEEFLAGGLARGERLLLVGERVIDSLPRLRLPSDVAELIAAGALETLTLAQAYEVAGAFLPEQQLSYYDQATKRAIADGYRGLRVVAEVSALAADPEVRPELVRWERVADDYIARGDGFTALCAYRAELAQESLSDVAAVHPLVHAPDGVATFRVFSDDERTVLAGSVDTFTADRLRRVLASAPVGTDAAVLELGLVEFLDVAACRALASWVGDLRNRSVAVEVRGASPLVRRMWQILALDELAPVAFAGSPT
jgi:anti-anti-sigma regulatory factor